MTINEPVKELVCLENGVRGFRRLLTVSQKIEALTGEGQRIFFANGRTIDEFVNGKISILYEHPYLRNGWAENRVNDNG